jgi:hypothetical protein
MTEAEGEFLLERVQWNELEAIANTPQVHPVLITLALLVQPEAQVPITSATLCQELAGTPEATAFMTMISTTLISSIRAFGLSAGLWRPLP